MSDPGPNDASLRDPRLIVCYNWKGGVGKTTFAVHLARYLAREKAPWCLWDADRQQDAISWITGHEWEGRPPDVKVSVGEGPRIPVTIRQETAVEQERLIIDAPPEERVVEDLMAVFAFTEGDLLVCPANGRLAIRGAVDVVRKVSGTGCRTLLVPNLTDPRDANASGELEALRQLAGGEDLGAELFELAIPRNDSYMRRAEQEGIPIWEVPHAEKTHTCKAMRAFCQWIAEGAPPDRNPPAGPAGDATAPISKDLKGRLWNG